MAVSRDGQAVITQYENCTAVTHRARVTFLHHVTLLEALFFQDVLVLYFLVFSPSAWPLRVTFLLHIRFRW